MFRTGRLGTRWKAAGLQSKTRADVKPRCEVSFALSIMPQPSRPNTGRTPQTRAWPHVLRAPRTFRKCPASANV